MNRRLALGTFVVVGSLLAGCAGSAAPTSGPTSPTIAPATAPPAPVASSVPTPAPTATPPEPTLVVIPGTIGRWGGDGSAGDGVGTADGTPRGGAGFDAGLFGQAFRLDGEDDYVELPASIVAYPADAPFTFEAWFLTTSSGVIFGQQSLEPFGNVFQAGNGAVPAIYVGMDGLLRAQLYWDGRVDPLTSEARVDDGAFHHVAVTFDGRLETAYLDGAPFAGRELVQRPYGPGTYFYQLGTGNTGVLWPAGPDGTGGWFSFAGLIDEVVLYDRALAAAEVAAIHAEGAAGAVP